MQLSISAHDLAIVLGYEFSLGDLLVNSQHAIILYFSFLKVDMFYWPSWMKSNGD